MSAETIRRSKEFQPEQIDGSYNEAALVEHEGELLAGVFADKGFMPEALVALEEQAGLASNLIGRYYLGQHPKEGHVNAHSPEEIGLQRVVRRAVQLLPQRQPSYAGTPYENHVITEGDAESYHRDQLRDLRRNGAQRHFRSGLIDVRAEGSPKAPGIEDVPVAVVGGGAAGVLTARAFVEAGFRNVTVLDQRGEAGGIWNRPNVHDGTKNNPFDIRYDGVVAESARDLNTPDQSGRNIQSFIQQVAGTGNTNVHSSTYSEDSQYKQPLTIEQALVTAIEPGELDHKVHVKSGSETETRSYPIVVYAPGIGKPLPLSDPAHMETPASRKEAGQRWQQQLTPEKLRELEGKRLVFIGLGNSTAEMVYQLQQYHDKTGRDIDYRIITHYPLVMTQSPTTEFADFGTLYRNVNKPDLTKLAGDLTHIRRLYERAQREGKIVSGVKSWRAEGKNIVAKDRDGIETAIPADGVYTLTGYGQDTDDLDRMGITCCIDNYSGTGAFDYDGEVQKTIGAAGRDRVHPGYFAIGPIMKNRFNPNAIVIPGIQGQLNNLLTTAVIRATEYALRNPDEIAKLKAACMPKPKQFRDLIAGLPEVHNLTTAA